MTTKKSLKIDIICADGSPLGVTYKTIWGDGRQIGVGGAELALLTLCEMWTDAGHNVTLYNNPRELGVSSFEQKNIDSFCSSDKRDILIIFRSPNSCAIQAVGKKIWLSCDQRTIGDFGTFASYVDEIICISDYHKEYFSKVYRIHNAKVIDLPVRIKDYKNMKIPKIKNRLIFTSIPERGLLNLWKTWDVIQKYIPDVSLVITSDYRLWGHNVPAQNEQHRIRWLAKNNVKFLGAIPRKQLIEEELKADIFAYPAIYDELLCLSCAEAQCAGAYPVTSNIGALSTTNMGTLVDSRMDERNFLATFSKRIIELLSDRGELEDLRKENKRMAINRFCPNTIMKEWDKLFREIL